MEGGGRRRIRHFLFTRHPPPATRHPPSGLVLDGLVASQILAAVAPAALEASLAAVAEVARERAALARQWQLRRERARYEAERATRQYQACEPENRLVARELERRWEEALQQQRQLEDDYGRWQRTAPAQLTDDDERAMRSLAADIPAVGGRRRPRRPTGSAAAGSCWSG